MARIQEGRKGTIKRLQNGPREKKSKVEFRRTTGIILRKLVKSLTDKIPEIQMEKAGRKLSRYPKRQETIPTSIASQMDECVTLLGSLDVSGMTVVTTQMEKIKLKVAKVDTDQEDISFWEELEILNEEDFSSLEELDQMEKAEKELMNRFEAGNNGGNKILLPISNQDDEQPEGNSPTDNFFIEEYEKMMEEKPTNNDESQEEHQNPSKDEEEEGRSSKDEEKEEEDGESDDPPQSPDDPSPPPPPSKKQKRKQPVKKTSRSPRSKTVRKTPTPKKKTTPRKPAPMLPPPPSTDTRRMSPTASMTPRKTQRLTETPKRKEQKPVKVNFNLGRKESEEDGDDPRGKVKKAKMQIEEKIRKEKRDKMLEELRKPILLTPGSKRGRQEDGEWEEQDRENGAPIACTARGLKQKTKQTPIYSFLVSQTPEDRQSSWKVQNMTRKIATSASRDTDMSALSASPSLRKTASKRTGVRKIQEEAKKEQKETGKVNIIVRYLESDQKPSQEQIGTQVSKNIDNNNQTCIRAAVGTNKNTTISSVHSSNNDPEMSSQSGKPSKPMRELSTGHVTGNMDPQPIEADQAKQHGVGDRGSHLGDQEGSE